MTEPATGGPGQWPSDTATTVTLDIDGDLVEYYAPGSDIPSLRLADLRSYEYRYDAAVDHHPRCRRAVGRLRLPGDVLRVFGALRWEDDRDAALLDEFAGAGLDTADPELLAAVLDAALFCVVADVTCRRCHSSSVVLRVEAGMPVSSAERCRAQRSRYRCPVCDDDSYIAHYEVLE